VPTPSLKNAIQRVKQRVDPLDLIRLANEYELDLSLDGPAGLDSAVLRNGPHLLKCRTGEVLIERV